MVENTSDIFDYSTIFGFCVNVLIFPFTIWIIYKRKRFHIYFRLILMLMVITIVIISLDCFALSVLQIISDNTNSKDDSNITRIIFSFLKMVRSYLNDIYRSTQWVFLCDRFWSTYFYYNYEKFKHPCAIPFIFFLIFTFTAIFVGIRLLIDFDNSDYITYLIFDVMLIILIIFLMHKNYSLKKNKLTMSETLTSKYQILENLYVGTFSLPIIIFINGQLFLSNVILLNIKGIVGSKKRLFSCLNMIQIYIFILLQFYMCLYEKISLIFGMKTNIIETVKDIEKKKNCKTNNSVRKNVLRNKVNDIYFETLNDIWENTK
uniref:G_PROTEIN_RECEP_F1_2 domain-containing protein n=1 Tax=Strongyloides venezuelensis TaxID=75913 RepID=A0A0K0FTK5_STRVS